MIPHRTNWRYQFLVLNQNEGAEAAILQSSILMHANFIIVLILTVNQLLLDTLINVHQWQLPPLVETPPKNCSTDEISDKDAHRLRLLLLEDP